MTSQNENTMEPKGLSALLASEPKIPDYTAMMSRRGRRLKPLEPRKTLFEEEPDLIVMDQGQPNTDPLPLAAVTFTLKDGEVIALDKETVSRIGKYDSSQGVSGMHKWLMKFQTEEHSPPQVTLKNHPSPFDLTMTCGSMAGIKGCLEVLMDENDTILTEEIVYAFIVWRVSNSRGECQPVHCDDQGMIPETLDDILTNWNQQHPHKTRPKVLYVIPYGNNPTGYSWTEERIVQTYLVCRKHDILILDDGAYHFLRWGKKSRSFQSIDVDGRVLRFDTLSKTMGAGHRIGWISGPQAIIDKVVIDASTSNGYPSSLSQSVILKILHTWGLDKFYDEMNLISKFYRLRAERILQAADQHLKGLAFCRVPTGGMFLWVEILGISDSTPIVKKLLDRGLLVLAGKFFRVDGLPSNGIRISFAAVAEDKLETAIILLADVLLEQRK